MSLESFGDAAGTDFSQGHSCPTPACISILHSSISTYPIIRRGRQEYRFVTVFSSYSSMRSFGDIQNEVGSEIVECVGQLLEGLEFMHDHHVAHRDACFYNIMVDSSKLVPDGNMSFFRPGRTIDWKRQVRGVERRSVAPLKYFFIDFETAIHYPPDQQDFLCIGRVGQERGAPELSDTIPYNPFRLDVYQLGMIFPKLLKKYDGIEFLQPLREAMTRDNPSERPTAAEASQMFKRLVASLSEDDMSRRIWSRMDILLGRRERYEISKLNTSLQSLFARLFSSAVSRVLH